MSKFYTHLIEIDSLLVELDKMDLSSEEKKQLTSLIDASLHQTILDAIFSQLNPSDKRAFVAKLAHEEDAKIWEFLNQKVDKIEDKIKQAAQNLKEELHQDIKKAHSLRKEK